MRHSLLVVLIGLMVSPAALAQTETQAPPASTCALRQPAVSRPRGLGTILGFQTPAIARAVVRQDDGWVQAFDVPQGLMVKVGQRVMLHGSYRSTALPCSYIPALVGADLPVG
jgi:hypothetical protein